MLIRVFLGWLRGEPRHCKMVAIPTLEEEDARRPSRERESLIGERTRIINRMKAALIRLGIRGFKPELLKAPQRLESQYTPKCVPIPPNMLDELRRDMARLAWVREQINAIEQARLERLEQAPSTGPHAMVRMLASIIGVGVETADMLVQEILSRNLRDRRAVARYAGLTGSPDESGVKRREKGLAKAGNARVRRGLIQLAWRFLRFQKESALGQWYRAMPEGATGKRTTTMIVALARKDAELARRKFVSITLNKKRTALAVTVERRKERKQFCAFSARARFHTAWTHTGHPIWAVLSRPANVHSRFFQNSAIC